MPYVYTHHQPRLSANKFGMVLIAIALLLILKVAAFGQVPGCPDGFVCITPAAARHAIEDGDARKALEAEKVKLLQAIEDLQKANTDWRVKYVEVFGRYDEIKQQRVEWNAEKEMLLKLIRPKKI